MLNKEEIKRQLKNELARCNKKIELWESVEYHTKKDGTEYESKKRTFTNCEYNTTLPLHGIYHPVVEVSGRCEGLSFKSSERYETWVKDEIYVYAYENDYHKDRYKDKEYIKPDSYSRPVYVLNNKEVMEEIKLRIEYLKGRAASLERQIANCDENTEKITKGLNQFLGLLQELDTDKGTNSLHSDYMYIVREMLTKQF